MLTGTWQFVGEDNWIYGEQIRGIVRKIEGEIYFNEESASPEGGWVWIAKKYSDNGVKLIDRGMAPSRSYAIAYVEQALMLDQGEIIVPTL